ncbi:hypothetical protein [Sorangium sp. So ce426]|uniref:hypothetical protein n=1 Tax=Sorangium sp. So ce426 TaxID=3133312 RepID=UPI003F5C62E1
MRATWLDLALTGQPQHAKALPGSRAAGQPGKQRKSKRDLEKSLDFALLFV